MIEKKSYVLEDYDRLLDVEEESTKWNEKCPYCGSSRLAIKPVGVVYQQVTDDYTDLPEEVRNHYRNLPNIVEAVLQCVDDNNSNTYPLVTCLNCNVATKGFLNEPEKGFMNKKINIARKDLKKYLERLYGMSVLLRLNNE